MLTLEHTLSWGQTLHVTNYEFHLECYTRAGKRTRRRAQGALNIQVLEKDFLSVRNLP
jgi:hypothetical protein